MPPVTIYTTRYCPYCSAAKTLLGKTNVAFNEIDVTGDAAGPQAKVLRAGGRSTVPRSFIGERHVGGCDDLYDLDQAGQLDALLAA